MQARRQQAVQALAHSPMSTAWSMPAASMTAMVSTILLAQAYPNSRFTGSDYHDASIEVAGNLNPVGRAYYNFSTLLCVPNALSQSGGYALGAQAGEAAIRQVITDAGFTRFRRAAETPFNLVYEVRP